MLIKFSALSPERSLSLFSPLVESPMTGFCVIYIQCTSRCDDIVIEISIFPILLSPLYFHICQRFAIQSHQGHTDKCICWPFETPHSVSRGKSNHHNRFEHIQRIDESAFPAAEWESHQNHCSWCIRRSRTTGEAVSMNYLNWICIFIIVLLLSAFDENVKIAIEIYSFWSFMRKSERESFERHQLTIADSRCFLLIKKKSTSLFFSVCHLFSLDDFSAPLSFIQLNENSLRWIADDGEKEEKTKSFIHFRRCSLSLISVPACCRSLLHFDTTMTAREIIARKFSE